METNLGAIIN